MDSRAEGRWPGGRDAAADQSVPGRRGKTGAGAARTGSCRSLRRVQAPRTPRFHARSLQVVQEKMSAVLSHTACGRSLVTRPQHAQEPGPPGNIQGAPRARRCVSAFRGFAPSPGTAPLRDRHGDDLRAPGEVIAQVQRSLATGPRFPSRRAERQGRVVPGPAARAQPQDQTPRPISR